MKRIKNRSQLIEGEIYWHEEHQWMKCSGYLKFHEMSKGAYWFYWLEDLLEDDQLIPLIQIGSLGIVKHLWELTALERKKALLEFIQ